jgi:hypothetical protein
LLIQILLSCENYQRPDEGQNTPGPKEFSSCVVIQNYNLNDRAVLQIKKISVLIKYLLLLKIIATKII